MARAPTTQSDREIAVTGGKIRGVVEHGLHVFRGVPFAAPVGGRDRWRPPQAVVAWDGVREAARFGHAALQPRPTGFGNPARFKRRGRIYYDAISYLGTDVGDDCLNLNVWTPTLDPAAKLPVAVWIHGGSLTAGAGSQPFYDGRHLAKAGMVVVTINYRLGAIGFVGADDLFAGDIAAANRGFLDQVQALRWVHENIRAFGGDRDQVTVMGESAGAQSVIAMASTPFTDGLIRRAISFSGAPLGAAPHADHSRLARDLFERLGVKPGDVDALAALEPAKLYAAQASIGAMLGKRRERYGVLGREHMSGFGMVTQTDLFPQAPNDFMRSGRKPDLDLMIGTCRDEARFLTILLPLPDPMAARFGFNFVSGVLKPPDNARAAFKAYSAAMPGASALAVRERAITDAIFRRPSVAFADAHAGTRAGRTFLYRFDWASPTMGAALHAIDVPGVFQTYAELLPLVGSEAEARPAGDALHHAVVSFIKSGKPNFPGPVNWPAYDEQAKACMIFDDPCRLAYDVDAAFAAVW